MCAGCITEGLYPVHLEPEEDAVLLIFYPTAVAVEFLDRLYDGKPQTGTSVTAGAGLINFIKAGPYLIQRFVRNLLS